LADPSLSLAFFAGWTSAAPSSIAFRAASERNPVRFSGGWTGEDEVVVSAIVVLTSSVAAETVEVPVEVEAAAAAATDLAGDLLKYDEIDRAAGGEGIFWVC